MNKCHTSELLIFSFLTTLYLSGLFIMIINLSNLAEEWATILSGSMGLIGGFLGAFGAYYAARMQIKKGENYNDKNALLTELRELSRSITKISREHRMFIEDIVIELQEINDVQIEKIKKNVRDLAKIKSKENFMLEIVTDNLDLDSRIFMNKLNNYEEYSRLRNTDSSRLHEQIREFVFSLNSTRSNYLSFLINLSKRIDKFPEHEESIIKIQVSSHSAVEEIGRKVKVLQTEINSVISKLHK